MRFFVYVVFISAAMFTFCACSNSPISQQITAENNFIKNSGFEEGDTVPNLWEKLIPEGGGNPELNWETAPERSSKCVSITLPKSGVGAWKQAVHLDPDGYYKLSGSIFTSNIQGKGTGAALLLPQFRWMQPIAAPMNSDWKKVETEFLNAGFTDLELLCCLGAYGMNSGVAKFDDIVISSLVDPAQDPTKTLPLKLGQYQLRYNNVRGYVTSLKLPQDRPDCPEFLGSYPTLPYLDPTRDHFLGDIAFDIKNQDQWSHFSTAETDCSHKISANANKLAITHSYPQEGLTLQSSISIGSSPDKLIWEIQFVNNSSKQVELGSVDLPLPWNDNYCLFDPHNKASQKLLYTRRVAEHKHIGGMSSYVLACPMDGSAPMILIHPADTQSEFEFTYHEPDTIRSQRRDPNRWIHGAWPGLTRLCLLSKSVMDRNNWTPWLNEHRSKTIEPGGQLTFRLGVDVIQKRDDVAATLSESGLLGLRVIPGMALPKNWTAAVIVEGGTSPFTVNGAASWNATTVSEEKNQHLITIQFDSEGEHTVEIIDKNGVSGRLFMFGLPDINELMTRRSRFILKQQYYTNPGSPLNGGIMCYNNRAASVLADPNDMWGSGGYEGGVTDAMFIALKNVSIPDKEEIGMLETYIHNWLLGKIQDPQDYGVAWTVSRPNRKERGYNYIHVLNLYDAMARGAALWTDLFQNNADHYLDLWMKTFNAFRSRGVRFQDLGLMGRGNVTFMPALMRRFNREDDAQLIEKEIQYWAKYWSEDPPYPFGSELFFDNTGYESVFFYRDYAGYRDLAQQALDVTLAGRGRASCWFWNDSDQRWWDAVRTSPTYKSFTDFGENCHHYMTGLNGYALLEAYDRHYNQEEPGPAGYSGILNSWARVTSDGFAGMCYCPDPASDNYGLNQFTGDVGLGLWGNLKAARCYAVKDPIIGWTGYGAKITVTDNAGNPDFTLEPFPGMNHRIRIPQISLAADADGLSFQSLATRQNLKEIRFTVTNESAYPCEGYVTLSGLPAGAYRFTEGKPANVDSEFQIEPDKNWAVNLKLKAGKNHGIVLVRAD